MPLHQWRDRRNLRRASSTSLTDVLNCRTLVKSCHLPEYPVATQTIARMPRKHIPAAASTAAPVARDVVVVGLAGAGDLLEAPEERLYSLSSDYLGGKKFWHQRLASRSDVH